jgi:glycosyltransferase involved in cell wall biosynthesis
MCGVHVPPRRPDRIAEAIQSLLDRDDERAAMGRRAVRRASRYDWPRVALDTRQHLEALGARADVPRARRPA